MTIDHKPVAYDKCECGHSRRAHLIKCMGDKGNCPCEEFKLPPAGTDNSTSEN